MRFYPRHLVPTLSGAEVDQLGGPPRRRKACVRMAWVKNLKIIKKYENYFSFEKH